MRLQVIEWPMKGSGKWWIVENRGTDEDPLYTPIAQHRTRAVARAVLEDMESAGREELEEAAAMYDRLTDGGNA